MIKIGFWVKDSKNKYFCNICGCPAIYHIKNNKWELEGFCPHCGAVMFIEKETEVSKMKTNKRLCDSTVTEVTDYLIFMLKESDDVYLIHDVLNHIVQLKYFSQKLDKD